MAVTNLKQLAQLFVWSGTHARPHHCRTTPGQFGASYSDISFPSASPDRTKLSGWLIQPQDVPRAIVILCHGHTSTRSEMTRRAVMLSSHHFTTLLFDFRARGMSEGSACTLGSLESGDVLGAVEFVSSQPGYNNEPIVVLGNSMGGAAAILAAATGTAAGNKIGAVIAEAAFARLDRAIEQRARLIAGPLGKPIAQSICKISIEQLGLDISHVSPCEVIDRISPRPVLLITDSLDLTCPRWQSDLLFERCKDPKQRWIVPLAPHSGAYQLYPMEYERRVTDFISELPHNT